MSLIVIIIAICIKVRTLISLLATRYSRADNFQCVLIQLCTTISRANLRNDALNEEIITLAILRNYT